MKEIKVRRVIWRGILYHRHLMSVLRICARKLETSIVAKQLITIAIEEKEGWGRRMSRLWTTHDVKESNKG